MKVVVVFVYFLLVSYDLAEEKSSGNSEANETNSKSIPINQPDLITETTEEDEVGESFKMDRIEIVEDRVEIRKFAAGLQKGEYPLAFSLKLDYFNSTMNLKMKTNEVIMGIRPKLIYYDENDTMIVDENFDDGCSYYKGIDVNTPNISAVITLCKDNIDGVVITDTKQLLIKPSRTRMLMQKSGGKLIFGPHFLKESKSYSNRKYRLDYVHVPDNTSENTEPRRLRRNIAHLADTKYVELALLVDNRHFVWLGKDIDKTMRRMKQVVNLVDTLYQHHNVRVILKAVEIWTFYDKMTVDLSIDNTLTTLYGHREYQVLPRLDNDCTILVTSLDFTGDAVGLAPVGAMCNARHSVNVCQDFKSDYTILSGTMAHEMGHNLGMHHDSRGCYCARPVCLMSPYSHDPMPKRFSDCSQRYLESFLKKDKGYCLMNIPDFETALYSEEKKCGNTKIDPGEECDCGLPKYCTTRCCNPYTCKLSRRSECASGGCCQDCKFKAIGTVCRKAEDSCDLEEKCDGRSPECPENYFAPNGNSCNVHEEDGYCHSGKCRTHTNQCRYVWGGYARKGDHRCYSKLNVRGDSYGNCGKSGGRFVGCSHSNAICGKLFCSDLPSSRSLPVIGFLQSRSQVRTSSNGHSFYCTSGSADLGIHAPDPFLTFDGTKCDDGKACKNAACVPVSEIKSPACTSDCNGHGVCSHKGTCACDPGYVEPDCQKAPPINSDSSRTLISELLVSLLIVFTTYVIM